MKSAGLEIKNFRAVGGGAKSPLWLQIKSDILNQPINTLRFREAACFGAAIFAGSATGIYNSIQEGVKITSKISQTIYPDEKRVYQYQKMFSVYKKIYPALISINKKLD
jgi:xylulokinase